ncbi:hypothetical protein LQ327_25040 [Actinomycetospora endophytica]|uniref:NIPSNAP protein n=1 Tax=Actinomycetospora endophytica TaxID=2291215 RepID=A0ABS8PI31_9PSEU|nr:hypothetical protein [Actinomycetospora endophytica]MCD2196644.1 hypothetical protein [Actinomycetospora endophytica]
MTFAVSYRLRAEERGRDRPLLREVYEELASVRPMWMTAETFAAADDQSMILLISTDFERRLSELAVLRRYRGGLDSRCEFPSQSYVVRRATIDKLPVAKIAFWNPYRRTWALPPDLPSGVPGLV